MGIGAAGSLPGGQRSRTAGQIDGERSLTSGGATDDPTRDDEFDDILDELTAAGYIERYTNAAGEQPMRLTPTGQEVAHQLAAVPEDDAAATMAGLRGDELEDSEEQRRPALRSDGPRISDGTMGPRGSSLP
jgi:hypothetical protein